MKSSFPWEVKLRRIFQKQLFAIKQGHYFRKEVLVTKITNVQDNIIKILKIGHRKNIYKR